MWRMAAILRPLFSKRATISPVRPRAKASGLTRMSVLSIEVLSFGSAVPAVRYARGGASVATVGWSVVAERRRRRVVGAEAAPVSASQYGQSFHAGSTGLPQE